jgi:hypothetical protein
VEIGKKIHLNKGSPHQGFFASTVGQGIFPDNFLLGYWIRRGGALSEAAAFIASFGLQNYHSCDSVKSTIFLKKNQKKTDSSIQTTFSNGYSDPASGQILCMDSFFILL